MNAFKNWKPILFGAGAVVVAIFIYEALTGQLSKNTAVFNPESYR